MSKDKSGKAQDILLGSISETTWLLCALALSSEQRAIPGGFGKFGVSAQTLLPSLVFTTHRLPG